MSRISPEAPIIAGLICFLGIAVWGWVLTRRRASAVTEILRELDSLGKGRPVRPIQMRTAGPLGRLTRGFDDSAQLLQERMTRLEQELERLRTVLSGMTEGVIAIDARRRLLFANERAIGLLGLGPESIGRLAAELIRSPQVQEAVDAALSGPGPVRTEVALPGREALDPTPARILSVLGTPLPGEPSPGAVLVFHDVTDLRHLERMRQDFVANASHELKTPLASIKAYTETLLDGALEDESVRVRFLQQISEQAERLDRLILDMLRLARLDSGQEAFQHTPIALGPVIRSCVQSHLDRVTARGLQLDLNLDAFNERAEVIADAEALRQILDNLLDNAIKYTPVGGWIRLTCRSSNRDIELEVADSGIGIPRAHLPRIFERFYRVDAARSRELGGTGLGLAIVKHLVQSVGGRIEVVSRIGVGSQFTVRLPRSAPTSP